MYEAVEEREARETEADTAVRSASQEKKEQSVHAGQTDVVSEPQDCCDPPPLPCASIPDALADIEEQQLGLTDATSLGTKNQTNESEVPRRKPKRRALIWSAAFVAVLLAVLTIASRRALKKTAQLKGPLLTSNPEEVKMFEEALQDQVEGFKRLWETASPATRQSFHAHYTPKVQGSSPTTSPLNLFERQVSWLLQKNRPGKRATPEQQGQYAQMLQIAWVVIKAAEARLVCLKQLEEFLAKAHRSDESRLSVRNPFFPGGTWTTSGGGLLSFRGFMNLLEPEKAASAGCGEASATDEAVPKALAHSLANSIQMHELQLEMDAKVHQVFHELLLITGTALPCGPQRPIEELAKTGALFSEQRRPFFPVSFFASLLSSFSRIHKAQEIPEEIISTWMYQWTYEGVTQRLTELEDLIRENASATASVKKTLVNRWVLLGPEDANDSTDFACLAFSLL
ncbi:hypothetical protein, conserved [Eimeria necatrix]|uniref:Transmembrane protein n=1 Tax=Eimeria necatrix TaxID=51315 RepID=U6MHE1_9EIME|nr:hypothetical protein, conserved [Eimeria necatrix]CDJ63451.1 hypothetical protein, conserved [Eimeria necatrix]